MADRTTKCVILSGLVQGVGMRNFIRRTARRMDITGYVRNLPDQTVECVCQGSEQNVRSFLNYIRANSPGTIRDISKKTCQDNKTYDSFSIRL